MTNTSTQPRVSVLQGCEDNLAITGLNALRSSYEYLQRVCFHKQWPDLAPLEDFITANRDKAFSEILGEISDHKNNLSSRRLSPQEFAAVVQADDRYIIELLSEGAEPTPGTVDALNALQASNTPYAVISKSSHARIKATLAAAKIDHYFADDKIFSAQGEVVDGILSFVPSIHDKALLEPSLKADHSISVHSTRRGVAAAVASNLLTIGNIGALQSLEERADRAKSLFEANAFCVTDDQRWVPVITEIIAEYGAEPSVLKEKLNVVRASTERGSLTFPENW